MALNPRKIVILQEPVRFKVSPMTYPVLMFRSLAKEFREEARRVDEGRDLKRKISEIINDPVAVGDLIKAFEAKFPLDAKNPEGMLLQTSDGPYQSGAKHLTDLTDFFYATLPAGTKMQVTHNPRKKNPWEVTFLEAPKAILNMTKKSYFSASDRFMDHMVLEEYQEPEAEADIAEKHEERGMEP